MRNGHPKFDSPPKKVLLAFDGIDILAFKTDDPEVAVIRHWMSCHRQEDRTWLYTRYCVYRVAWKHIQWFFDKRITLAVLIRQAIGNEYTLFDYYGETFSQQVTIPYSAIPKSYLPKPKSWYDEDLVED